VVAIVGSRTISHLPAPAPVQVVPGLGTGLPTRIVSTPQPGAAITINGIAVSMDLTKHGIDNILALINGAAPGLATIDRLGRLVLVGTPNIGGDLATLQALGLA